MKTSYNYQSSIHSVSVSLELLSKIEDFLNNKITNLIDTNGELRVSLHELELELKELDKEYVNLSKESDSSREKLQKSGEEFDKKVSDKLKYDYDILELKKNYNRNRKDILQNKKNQNSHKFRIILYDEYGNETLSSIKDYSDSKLNNDIQRIAIRFELNTFFEQYCELTIIFDKEKSISNFQLNLASKNSKSIGHGIFKGVQQILQNYHNSNHLFHPNAAISALLWSYIIFSTLTTVINISDGKLSEFDAINWSLVLLLIIAVAYQLTAKYLKPYIQFETRLQDKLDDRSSKLFWIMIAFLIGGFSLIFFRRQIFGF